MPNRITHFYSAGCTDPTHTVVLVVETYGRGLICAVDRPVFPLSGAAMSPPIRIAVIDDDEEMRLALDDLLTSFSHEVKCYADGISFLDGHQDFRPDLIVTDYHMPGLTGIETIRRFRATEASTPAILITAFANEIARRAAVEVGCLALLKKPFDPDELISLIDKAVGR